MDDMVDMEERPPGEVRPPIREEGELQRPPSTWSKLMMRSKTIRFANGLNSKFEAVLLHFQNLHLHQGGILLLNDLLQHGHAAVGHLEGVGQSKESQQLARQERYRAGL